ncbi:hypothetical protein [Aeromonas veronii]|uniref:hypothetical protein n=1 Tax=Aeromonas veronii TaxID=654 RepID=UPI00058A1C5E|nr:hypothetical protein [Aeromonas veronii]
MAEALDGLGDGESQDVRLPEDYINEVESEEAKDGKTKRRLRTHVAWGMLSLIFIVNAAVIFIVYKMMYIDAALLIDKAIKSSDRVIDSKAVLSLIAGSVTQVAAMFVFVVKFLFAEDKRA